MLRRTVSSVGLSNIKPVADKKYKSNDKMTITFNDENSAFTTSFKDIGKVTILPLPNSQVDQ